METRAVAKYVRVSPQKVRLVTDMIRGKDLLEAQHLLEYSEKAAAGILAKLLASAAANAENNNGLRLEDLYIARVFVDEGPTLPMRYRMRAMGRVGRIHKRTSHITVILEEREPEEERKKRRFTMRRPKREKPEEEMELEELEEEEMELEGEPGAVEEEAEAVHESPEVEENPPLETEALSEPEAGEEAETGDAGTGGTEKEDEPEEIIPAEEGETNKDDSEEKGEA